ncbi:tetratricopeptide repeat protein [Shewanella sp. UCD-KL21]|uniref:SEL1-like repeat protein n=1 Tax=Shewanella sp. UCD-KL21 TaxID=1917164 RepID=UPI0009702984|nr:tetratricopeptide repeat protein [Shewanella sp. UCD-KL21]
MKYSQKLLSVGLACSLGLLTSVSAPVSAFSIPQSEASQAASKLVHIQLRAAEGNADAQFLLGLMSFAGRFVDQDIDQGLYWVEQAALQDHIKAQQTLADLTFEGKLLPRDLAVAEKWYQSLAKHGDPRAHFRLGFIYSAGGDGVSRSCGKALEQFTQAGDAIALGNVAWILATCPEEEYRDGSKAVQLALQLLESNANDPTNLDNLAAAYAEMGEFELAVDTQQKAIEALKQNPEVAQSDEFMMRLEQYQQGRAYREIIPLMN